jgi:hypothetical protein
MPDYQVARPVQAPNYVGMYSEAIRGALMPFQQLLEEEKAQSEDSLRKAQIQNFLDTHEENRQTHAETVRSHLADEAMKHLGYDLDVRKQSEAERHNQADEADAVRRTDLYGRQADETQRHDQAEEERQAQQEKELERHNQWMDEQNKRENDLRDEAQKAKQATDAAEISRTTAQAKAITAENEARERDDKVFAEAQDWIKNVTPEQIWSSQDNPEIRSKIDEFTSRMHTKDGRDQLDNLIGGKSGLGQEVSDRKLLNGMSEDAKRTFRETLEGSDKTIPPQTAWNNALEKAKRVQGDYEERQKWGTNGLDAYNLAYRNSKATDPDERRQEAMAAGRQAQFILTTTEKIKPAAANPGMVKQLFESLYQEPVKQKGETNDQFAARDSKAKADAQQRAVELEKLSRENPDEFNRQYGQTQKTQVKDLNDFSSRLLNPGSKQPDKSKPDVIDQTDLQRGGTSIQPATNAPSRLASATSAIMPSGAPRYVTDGSFNALADVLNTQFGPNVPAQTGSDDQTDLASAIPIHESGHPMPRSPEEASSLGVGTRFMDPNGTIREVPAQYA